MVEILAKVAGALGLFALSLPAVVVGVGVQCKSITKLEEAKDMWHERSAAKKEAKEVTDGTK